MQAIAVPRTQLHAAVKRDEAGHVAVYLLFGHSDESAKPLVYIGQTEDLCARLRKRNVEKDFWQTAVFIISRAHSFTQAHIRYLEWLFIKKASEAKRFELENGNAGRRPFVTEPMEADLLDVYETANVLVGALGFPVFEPLKTPSESTPKTLFCTGPDANGRGRYVDDGFVVLAGSRCRKKLVASAASTFAESSRHMLLQKGKLQEENGHLVLKDDYLFKSPSGAAMLA